MNPSTSKHESPSGTNTGDFQKPNVNKQGFSNETEPTWAPPESQPEPRPIEPILDEPIKTT